MAPLHLLLLGLGHSYSCHSGWEERGGEHLPQVLLMLLGSPSAYCVACLLCAAGLVWVLCLGRRGGVASTQPVLG